MRKIIAILLLMIYSVCSTGATIYLHHCGKSTFLSLDQSTKVSHENCPNCSKCQDKSSHEHGDSCKKGCCQDKELSLKSDSEQLQSKSTFADLINFAPAVVLIPWIMEQWKIFVDDPAQEYHSMAFIPIKDLEPVYILNCTYRI